MKNKSIFDKVRKSVEKALENEPVIPPKEQILEEIKYAESSMQKE